MPPFVDQQTISKEIMDRFKAFNDAMMQFNNNEEAAQNTMRRDFENTFTGITCCISIQMLRTLLTKNQ